MLKISNVFKIEETGGKLALCQCPGKILQKGRDGKPRNRNIKQDLEDFKAQGVSMVVCLLNDYELRTIGVKIDVYKAILKKLDVEFIQYPILEMAAPASVREVEESVLNPISAALFQGREVLVHCRGGIGRAGTIASCLLLKLRLSPTPESAISLVRRKRDPRCVESRKQEDFIREYFSACIRN
jgi:protein-tyrosine phosphatase